MPPDIVILGELNALGSMQASLLGALSGTVEKYLDQSGRRWVDLGALFSFMKV